MIQLPQLQESLLLANDRLVERAQRRARRFRLGLFTSVAVVGASGVAVGAGALWGPILGQEDGNRPTAGTSDVPAVQRDMLPVLARDQTNADRGPAAQVALRDATRRYEGIRTGAVRLVADDGHGGGLVLVPVEHVDPRDQSALAPGTASGDDALCLYEVQDGAAATNRCFTEPQVRAGTAAVAVGDTAGGLVPAGVSAVRMSLSTGGTRDVPVRDNGFLVDTRGLARTSPVARWVDDAGRLTGGFSVLQLAPERNAPLPHGWHRCGADLVVPADVRCGREARRWRPAPGQAVPYRAPVGRG